MLRMRGILRGEDKPMAVQVLMNTKVELGKTPDRSGEIIVPLGTRLTAGEKFLLVIVDAKKFSLGLPGGDSMHILINYASEGRITFVPTSP